MDLPYALDVENNRVDPAAVPVWLQAVRVSDHGRKPFIYSNPDTIAHCLKDKNFAEYPLWYAFYRQHEVPANAGAWSQWTMLQYTDRGSVPGITGHVDKNEYNGRLER
ncbi:GH25 family lysozyme [Paenibacillus tarimensis]|uniref:GH25 family lysozyme n=1 Tax=Paenibacillus tarimensis TaxID=416012 RepID=UPI0038B2B4CB